MRTHLLLVCVIGMMVMSHCVITFTGCNVILHYFSKHCFAHVSILWLSFGLISNDNHRLRVSMSIENMLLVTLLGLFSPITNLLINKHIETYLSLSHSSFSMLAGFIRPYLSSMRCASRLIITDTPSRYLVCVRYGPNNAIAFGK